MKPSHQHILSKQDWCINYAYGWSRPTQLAGRRNAGYQLERLPYGEGRPLLPSSSSLLVQAFDPQLMRVILNPEIRIPTRLNSQGAFNGGIQILNRLPH